MPRRVIGNWEVTLLARHFYSSAETPIIHRCVPVPRDAVEHSEDRRLIVTKLRRFSPARPV